MAASIPTEMRALISNLPESSDPALSVKTVATPTPKAGEVLIKVRASGLNASDCSNALANRFRRETPVTVGRDFAGTVVAAPATPALVGARVFGSSGDCLSLLRDGTQSEYLVLPEDGVARIPDGVSFAQAGAAGVPYSTAYIALLRAQLEVRKEGEREQVVLVLGAAGAVGRAVQQITRARGHFIITASRSDGMDINVTKDPEMIDSLGKASSGRRADVVVDCAGDPVQTEAALALLNRGGRYAVVTTKGGKGQFIKADFQRLYTRDQSIVGVFSARLNLAENQKALQEIADLVTAGKITLDTEDVFDLVPFADAVATYPKAMEFSGKKYVFVFDE